MRRWFLMTVQIDEIYLRERKEPFYRVLVFFPVSFAIFKKKNFI